MSSKNNFTSDINPSGLVSRILRHKDNPKVDYFNDVH